MSKELREKLVKLIKENPDLEVKFFITTEVDDDYPYQEGELVKVEISDWFVRECDNYVYTDFEEFTENIFNNEWNCEWTSEEEAEYENKRTKELEEEWTKRNKSVILVVLD